MVQKRAFKEVVKEKGINEPVKLINYESRDYRRNTKVNTLYEKNRMIWNRGVIPLVCRTERRKDARTTERINTNNFREDRLAKTY